MKRLILARLLHDEPSVPPAGESVYFRKAFDLWPGVYLGAPLGDHEASSEELWPEAQPEDDGLFHFEISGELAFTVPGLDGQEQVFEVAGRKVVLTNQMYRVSYVEEAGDGDVLRYALVHGAGLDATEARLNGAPRFVDPLRTFFTCPVAAQADSANAAIRRNLKRWLDQLAADVSFVLDAYRTTDPKNTARFGEMTSIHAFSNVWVAVDSGQESTAHQWTSDFRRTSVTPANGVTEWGRSRIKAVVGGEEPVHRHLLLMASAYRHSYNGDLERAAVDLSMAMESFLAQQLSPYVEARQGQEDDVEKAGGGEWVTYSQLLNDYLPLKLDPTTTKGYASIVGILDRVRRLRNQVVHAGGFTKPVHKSEIERALDAAGKLINLVLGITTDEHSGLIKAQ